MKKLFAIATVAVALNGFQPWIRGLDAGSKWNAVFFRTVNFPAGPVEVRRPPKETRPELNNLISATPQEADLYSLRAREAEMLLDFAAAEADWKKYAELGKDKIASNVALADYYHRRVEPQKELAALLEAARQSARAEDRFRSAAEQQSWKLFRRAETVRRLHLLPAEAEASIFTAWMARYPAERDVAQQYFRFRLANKDFSAAEQAVADYSRRFPQDPDFPIEARAELAERRGSAAQAVAVYEQSYRPDWPDRTANRYFDLLKRTKGLRAAVNARRAALAANPLDVGAVTWLYRSYRREGNAAAAGAVLMEFSRRKKQWTAAELGVTAQLMAAVDLDESARLYYILYGLQGEAGNAERGLTGLANLLLATPEAPMHFGSGDLTYYRDIGAADPGPGFLNGILSLVLNSSNAPSRFAAQEQAGVAYFHRAMAAELLTLLDRRFPQSPGRPQLWHRLIETYMTYGDSDAVIRWAQKFLRDFPQAPQRAEVSLRMAEAQAHKRQVNAELAVYDALLDELSARADRVPLGEGKAPRSPEYVRVLDRYLARLAALKRTRDAMALLRRELDRNPDDPGMYERLAAYLDQNRVAAEVEQVYRKAIGRFPDKSWYHKLARYYLRRKQSAEFSRLSGEVAKVFSGTELESYFSDVVAKGSLDPVLYRQVNLYAAQRFPHNLVFLRNLLDAYQRKGTADPVAWEQLLRRSWFYADDLRSRFFEYLSRTGKLNAELAALRVNTQPAARQMLAEGEAWRAHFEAAGPVLRTLAMETPGDEDLGARTAKLQRSLGAFDRKATDSALETETNLSKAAPRRLEPLTRFGEIQADREQFARARASWNRMTAIEPGNAENYLETATVFWDYYQYDDALRVIQEGRRRLGNPELYAYEAGAIYENKRDYARAIGEYVNGAAQQGAESPAESRLLTLARRAAHRAAVDNATARLVTGEPTAAGLRLRLAVLEAQDRRADVEALLTGLARRVSAEETLAAVQELATQHGVPAAQEAVLERQVALSTDATDTVRLRLEQARLFESRKDLASAARVMDGVYRDNPKLLGVVRSAVNFHWRAKNAQRALDVLGEASRSAYPELKKQLVFEAAKKSVEVGQTLNGRRLLEPLLAEEPLRMDYIAVVADSYARQGDDAGLRAFYQAKISAIQGQVGQVASLRRSLVPVLTRLKDYSAAVDQYIWIVNRFPEDEGLLAEVSAYALKQQLMPRVIGYYTKAVAGAPRDFRWPMVLARLETAAEHYPEAVAAYRKASESRPDRVDLLTARGGLEERLLRFDDAVGTYTKVYELSYRDPQWMERVALLQARSGRKEQAVAALRQALVEGRGETPEVFQRYAQSLERWNYLPEAREAIEKAVALAGPRLASDYVDVAATYATVLARLRLQEQALAKLLAAPNPGYALDNALAAMGRTAARYYSPEEKLTFAQVLDKQTADLKRLRPLAHEAGLLDLEARWMQQALVAAPGPAAAGTLNELVELQQRRLEFDALGAQLEAYWKVFPAGDERAGILMRAAEMYRLTGNTAAELRVLALAGGGERYLELLAARDPRQLVQIAGGRGARDAAASAAIASGNAALAMHALAARGTGMPPVWTKAYTALTGLFLNVRTPQVQAAFTDALGIAPVGERVGRPADRAQKLTGDTWFYYGARYGEYLAYGQQADADDLLLATLEARPAHAGAYSAVADFYRERKNFEAALADYQNALELAPASAALHHKIALTLFDQGKKDEAIAAWKRAMTGSLSPLDNIVVSVSERNLLESLKADLTSAITATLRRTNDVFGYQNLILAAAKAGGVDWAVELSRVAKNPVDLLRPLLDDKDLLAGQLGPVHERVMEVQEQQLAKSFGEARFPAMEAATQARLRYVRYLMDQRQWDRAQAAMAGFTAEARERSAIEVGRVETLLAARTGRLGAVLERHKRDPGSLPTYTLRDIANDLRAAGDAASARMLLQVVYEEESNLLGLAELRLEENDAAAAMVHLRRLLLTTPDPSQVLLSAAEMLRKGGRTAEAQEFLRTRAKLSPWDARAQAALDDPKVLAAIVTDPSAEYAARLEAARKLKNGAPATGSGELDTIASGRLDAASVEKPYFVASRILAASQTADAAVKLRLLLGAARIEPGAEALRLPLLRAVLATRRPALAVAIAERSGPSRYSALTETLANLSEQSGLSKTDIEQLRGAIADAYAQTENWQGAINLLSESPSPPKARIAAYRRAMERRQENEMRRPQIHATVEQSRVVKPMLRGGEQ